MATRPTLFIHYNSTYTPHLPYLDAPTITFLTITILLLLRQPRRPS